MFSIGVDLGQKHDYTAIAVVEKENAQLINCPRVYAAQEPRAANLLVRRVQRVPLGTPYPRVAEYIRALTHQPPMAGHCALAIDATGVGAPVVDMLRAPGLGCSLTAVTITGGKRESPGGSMSINVPRRDLIAGVQLALEKGELKISRRIPELGSLLRELIDMPLDNSGGDHDDLVMALALACWRARRKNIYPGGRLTGF